jgi:hypothetical protein
MYHIMLHSHKLLDVVDLIYDIFECYLKTTSPQYQIVHGEQVYKLKVYWDLTTSINHRCLQTYVVIIKSLVWLLLLATVVQGAPSTKTHDKVDEWYSIRPCFKTYPTCHCLVDKT